MGGRDGRDRIMILPCNRPTGKIFIIGVQPKEVCWGRALSPEVQASIPKLTDLILKEINQVSEDFFATENSEVTESKFEIGIPRNGGLNKYECPKFK